MLNLLPGQIEEEEEETIILTNIKEISINYQSDVYICITYINYMNVRRPGAPPVAEATAARDSQQSVTRKQFCNSFSGFSNRLHTEKAQGRLKIYEHCV